MSIGVCMCVFAEIVLLLNVFRGCACVAVVFVRCIQCCVFVVRGVCFCFVGLGLLSVLCLCLIVGVCLFLFVAANVNRFVCVFLLRLCCC